MTATSPTAIAGPDASIDASWTPAQRIDATVVVDGEVVVDGSHLGGDVDEMVSDARATLRAIAAR